MGLAIFGRKTSFVEFLGICCVFSVFLDKAIRGVLPFDFYFNYPIFILFLLAMLLEKGRIASLPKWFLVGLVTILVCSTFILFITGRMGFEFFKQVFGILFTSIVFYNVLYVFQFDIPRIFSMYLRFAFWVALFGIVSNILHFAGIHLTQVIPTGFLYRESSIMGEPFYLALALTPAIGYFTAFFHKAWKERRREMVAVFICYLITYSSIAVAGFALSVFFALYLNDFFNVRRNRLMLAPFLIIPLALFINFLISNIKLINVRFTDTTSLFFSGEVSTNQAGAANSSSFALYSNYVIARDSFLKEPLFGSGLGSHPLIYQETFLKYFPSMFLERYGAQNQQDANSKFLRLMSETGLVGLFLFLWAFVKFFAPKNKMRTPQLKELGAINYSIFIYILLCLIRNGNYINVGFFLFFFIYYATWSIINQGGSNAAAAQPTSRV